MSPAPMSALVLAAASTSLLSVLKYVLLAILWLFFILVLRGVFTEVRRPPGTDTTAPPPRSSVARPSVASRLAGNIRPPRFEPIASPPRYEPARSEPAPGPPAFESERSPAPGPRPFDPERFDPPTQARPDPRTLVAGLTIREPAPIAGRTFPVGDEVTLGRAPTSTVSLPEDSFVSSKHARVWRIAGEVRVEDLGSTNGTFVNGTRLSEPVALQPGDRLQVGRTILEATR